MYLPKPSMYAAGEWQCTAASREVSKYVGVVFPSDGKRNKELDTQFGKSWKSIAWPLTL